MLSLRHLVILSWLQLPQVSVHFSLCPIFDDSTCFAFRQMFADSPFFHEMLAIFATLRCHQDGTELPVFARHAPSVQKFFAQIRQNQIQSLIRTSH